VIGVDGCAGGWIAASRDTRGAISCTRVNALAELFDNSKCPRVVAVDVPIGLLARGARECGVEARRLLGDRRSSVFPAPIRPILTATSQDASRIRRRVEGKGVSIQTWAIVPKIVEADACLRADDVRREIVHEVHPEVSFFFLNGKRPMNMAKKKTDGQVERLAVLRKWAGAAIVDALARRRELGCNADDIVDAVGGALDCRAHRVRDGYFNPRQAAVGCIRPTDGDGGMSVPTNNAFDRTAGSHSLAAGGQRARSAVRCRKEE